MATYRCSRCSAICENSVMKDAGVLVRLPARVSPSSPFTSVSHSSLPFFSGGRVRSRLCRIHRPSFVAKRSGRSSAHRLPKCLPLPCIKISFAAWRASLGLLSLIPPNSFTPAEGDPGIISKNDLVPSMCLIRVPAFQPHTPSGESPMTCVKRSHQGRSATFNRRASSLSDTSRRS